MSYQHSGLAAGRWNELTFCEQMANIGSEIERALNWHAKKNTAYSERAFERALELLDLTLAATHRGGRLKELARVREAIVDYFIGTNASASTDASWKSYFLPFTYAARRTR